MTATSSSNSSHDDAKNDHIRFSHPFFVFFNLVDHELDQAEQRTSGRLQPNQKTVQ